MYKSFKEISLPITEEEYRNDGAMHYSTLATYARGGFECLNTLFERKESSSLLLGSAVDALITGGKEEYDNHYFVADMPSMTDSLMPIAKQLFDTYHSIYSTLDDISDNYIAQIGKDNNFYANDKYKNYRIKLIREGCSEYYKMKFLAGDKQVISSEFHQTVLNMAIALKTSMATAWYFAEDNPFDNIERCYQLKFHMDKDDIPYSCMADLILIDNDNKKIYPCDLKTSSHTEYDFYKSFIDWSYHIQARLYWRIIRDNMDKDDVFKDYELMDYTFIVVNKNTLNPLTWTFEDTKATGTLYYGKNGQIECRDPFDLAKELNYYLKSNPIVPNGINLSKPNSLTQWLISL
jgi:hypothetical protein